MSISRLPSGRWRAQIYDPETGRNVPVAPILGLPAGTTWDTKRDAKIAREKARETMRAREQKVIDGPTVREFWERWLTDPVFARPKRSTMIHNRERTRQFVAKHADLALKTIDHEIASAWIAGGQHRGTVPALRAMFNDAAGPLGPRLILVNPFAKLGLERSKGRAGQQPPSLEMAQRLVEAATREAPGFGAWLAVATSTGMRPGELDALRWDDIDLNGGWIHVRRQLSSTSHEFTLPKNGLERPVPLHADARAALERLPERDGFVFRNLSGEHWTASARAYHWKAARRAAGWDGSLYLATRHFAGWVMYELLLLDAEDVAFALGHTDGGELVRRTYGHRSRDAALQRVKDAMASRQAPPGKRLRRIA